MNDKICIITDTHWGIKSDNLSIMDYQKKFYDNVFFPYLKKQNIDTIIHMGDLVDRRKFINYYTALRLDKDFMKPILGNIDFHIITGNHDTFYKNTNKLNSIEKLYGSSRNGFHVYTDPTEVNIKGINFLMLPWICEDNYQSSMDYIHTSNAEIVISHLELNGFEMDRGNVSHSGMDHKILDRFPRVYSGHFHHKSAVDNIHYLGAPCQYTWIDYDDPKGFHILDTKTKELQYIRNPYEIYKKFIYDDKHKSNSSEMLNFDASLFNGSYTKVIVKNKNDPYLFDMVIAKLEEAEPLDIAILEDIVDISSVDDIEESSEVQDTVTIFKKYIETIDTKIDKAKIENFMTNLYIEALNQED